MFVYVITGDDGFVKVGKADCPKSRLALLQTAHHSTLRLAHEQRCDRALAVEAYAHWLLREHHARGEWFRATVEQAMMAIEIAEFEVGRGKSAVLNKQTGLTTRHHEPEAIAFWAPNSRVGEGCSLSTANDAIMRRKTMDSAYRRLVKPSER